MSCIHEPPRFVDVRAAEPWLAMDPDQAAHTAVTVNVRVLHRLSFEPLIASGRIMLRTCRSSVVLGVVVLVYLMYKPCVDSKHIP